MTKANWPTTVPAGFDDSNFWSRDSVSSISLNR